MQGLILLTEARSGSSWLGSLANSTGCLGRSNEWFVPGLLGPDANRLSAEAYLARVIERASTPNGVFAIKLFPAHLHWFQYQHGLDALDWLKHHHQVALQRLSRRDRVLQAVSYARGVQARAWEGANATGKGARYDFDSICRCYFLIERSEAFWDTYLALRAAPVQRFYYEDLVADPGAYISTLATHAGIRSLNPPVSDMRMQKDGDSAAWADRFRTEAQARGLLVAAAPSRPYRRNPANLLRFLRGQQMKPYPYSY